MSLDTNPTKTGSVDCAGSISGWILTLTSALQYQFDTHLNYKVRLNNPLKIWSASCLPFAAQLWSVIQKYSRGKSTLVFCPTRKGCLSAAQQLRKDAGNALIADKDRHNRYLS